jgi:acyl-CoA synthetase (NDP forming)
MPDLLPEDSAIELGERGIGAAAGLFEGIRCARAVRMPPPAPARLEEIAAAAARPAAGTGGGEWLGEAESIGLLAGAGMPLPPFAIAGDAEAAVTAAAGIEGPVAVKLSRPGLRHKSEAGALALALTGADEVRAAAERLLALPEGAGGELIVEGMAAGEAELIVAARRDGVVPVLAIGLGGVWIEALDDVAIVPLPASRERVEEALRGLRAAALLRGRGGGALDIGAAAQFGSRLGELLVEEDLDLIEVNPVLLGREGCVAVDALARRRA